MQFTTALLALLASPAAAVFDSAACSGIGACTFPSGCNYSGSGSPSSAEWDCGTAGTINGQAAASAELNFELGLSADQVMVLSASEFPKSCNLKQPPATGATLLKAVYEDVTVYGWIEYSCTETKAITDACYSSVRNGSPTYTCLVLKNGTACSHVSKTLEGTC